VKCDWSKVTIALSTVIIAIKTTAIIIETTRSSAKAEEPSVEIV